MMLDSLPQLLPSYHLNLLFDLSGESLCAIGFVILLTLDLRNTSSELIFGNMAFVWKVSEFNWIVNIIHKTMRHKILLTYKFTNSLQWKIWMIHGYKIIPILPGFLTFQKLKQGTYMWISRGKKCLFFRKFGVLCFLLTPVLKSVLFALLLKIFDICKIFCIYAKCLNIVL